MRCLIVAILVVCASSLNPLDKDWEAYKALHGKIYEGVVDTSRRVIWEKNLKIIAKHNIEASNGLHSYKLGMNVFGDMVSEDNETVILFSIKFLIVKFS